MKEVETLKARCPVCSSRNFVASIGDDFDGVILKCNLCLFEDFIGNPFGDMRIFLDSPKNWCLVFIPKKPIL